MRSYRRNSPEAAGRIIAWTLLADGHMCASELAACEEAQWLTTLGMTREGWNRVVQELCEDLLANGGPTWERAVRLDEATFKALLSELDDSALRDRVLALGARVTASRSTSATLADSLRVAA